MAFKNTTSQLSVLVQTNKQNKTKPSRVRCDEPALARLKPDSGVRANLGYTVRPPPKPTTKQQHQNDYYLVKRNQKNTWGPTPVQDTSLKIYKAQAEVPGEMGGGALPPIKFQPPGSRG